MHKIIAETSSQDASPEHDEIIFCQILLDLRNLMSLSESLSNFNWGCRRRRSSLVAPPPLPPPPSSSTSTINPEKAAAPTTSSSPDTPLSFMITQSHDRSKKSSKKRSREEYIEMIDELTQRKELLRGEIQNVKKYYNKLKACNSALKALKQEVQNSCPRKEEPQIGTMELKLNHHFRMNVACHHPPPLIEDPTAQRSQYPFGNGLGPGKRSSPLEFDLNIPAEEAVDVDNCGSLDVSGALADKRMRFAEARRLRKGIIKIRAMRSACGIKLPMTR